MKHLKLFKEMKSNPDLRKITEIVECVKPLEGFTKNTLYDVSAMFGDPQRAIEEFNINDYIPIECSSHVHIINDKGERIKFIVNDKYKLNSPQFETNHYFLDHFKLVKEADAIKKFNI